MNNLLDISIHGPQRVAIVEQLVHICRYNPGAVLLEGDAGKSPVNFLRDMANLLRDELDFALLDTAHFNVPHITAELISQWYIYRSDEQEQTDTQLIHHYLDLGLQSGRLTLIVVERTSLLTDDAANFLVGLMARHSRLTVLFAGVVDSRPLLRRIQQAEVPVHRIDLPDSADLSKPLSNSASGFDHTFFDNSYELPDDELEDDLCEPDFLVAEPRNRRESAMYSNADSMLGVSSRLSAVQTWGAATFVGITRKRSASSIALLVVGCLVLVILLMLMVRYSGNVETGVGGQVMAVPAAALEGAGHSQVQPVVAESPLAPVVSGIPANSISETATKPSIEEKPSVVAPVAIPAPRIQDAGVQQPAAAKPVASATEKSINKTEKQWLAKPDNYTVQIAAAHGEANIRKLEARLPTGQPHLLYRTTRNGRPWFVLIYGSFASKQAAASARDSLAADIKKDSAPWVRKQGEVFVR